MEIINRHRAVQTIRHTNELSSHIEHRVLFESKTKIDPNSNEAVDGALMCETTDSDNYETNETLRPVLMVVLKKQLGFRAMGIDFCISRTYAHAFAGNINISDR